MSRVLLPLSLLLVGFTLVSCYIPLQNGETYSSILFSGQTIVFGYNMTDPCADLIITSWGHGDIWCSKTEEVPHVYGYSTYVATCDGDVLHIRHDDAYFTPPSLYFIGAYLDPIIYDDPINMTINVQEVLAPTIISSESTLSITGTAGESESSFQKICIRDAGLGLTFQPDSFDEAKSLLMVLTKHEPDLPTTWETLLASQQSMITTWINGSSSSIILSSYFDDAFTAGDYYVNVFSFCNDCGTCNDPVEYNITAYIPADLPIPVPPIYTPVTLEYGTPYLGQIEAGELLHFFVAGVGICDDVTISVTNMDVGSEVDVFASPMSTFYPTSSSYSWKSFGCGGSSILNVNHADPAFSMGDYYITLFCDANECSGTNFNIVVQKELGADTLTPQATYSYSGIALSDTMHWYSVCVPTADISLNITSITHNSTQEFELIDMVASRIPHFESNYTLYTEAGVPHWNFWANWEYSTRPFPRCPASFFLTPQDASTEFTPGMFYIGVYSFCLNSCLYCHGDIAYTMQISEAGALDDCGPLDPPTSSTSPTTSESTTATTTTSAVVTAGSSTIHTLYITLTVAIATIFLLQ